jgi:hypothetical protein
MLQSILLFIVPWEMFIDHFPGELGFLEERGKLSAGGPVG